MKFGNWTPVASGRGWEKEKSGRETSESQNSKRDFEENSSNEGSSRVVRKRAFKGEFKVIVRFSKEDEQIILRPVVKGIEKEAWGGGSGENFETY